MLNLGRLSRSSKVIKFITFLDKTKFHKNSYIFLTIIIVLYMIIQVICVILTLIGKLDKDSFEKQLAIITIILVASFLIIGIISS